MKKLYELPERQNVKLYFENETDHKEDKVIIFDHIDGFYSYCWFDKEKWKLVHINANTTFVKYKDGYKYVEEK